MRRVGAQREALADTVDFLAGIEQQAKQALQVQAMATINALRADLQQKVAEQIDKLMSALVEHLDELALLDLAINSGAQCQRRRPSRATSSRRLPAGLQRRQARRRDRGPALEAHTR